MERRGAGRRRCELGLCLLWLAAMLAAGRAQACDTGKPLRVAVDTGHSASRWGATSARGKREFDFNKRFVAELLEMGEGWPELQLVSVGNQPGLIDRVGAAEALKSDVFVSIHHDSVSPKYLKAWTHDGKSRPYADEFRGYSIFVSDEGERRGSLDLATLFGRALRAGGYTPTLHHAEPIMGEGRRLLDAGLGIYEAPFVVLTKNSRPAILFEAGVIVHRAEELDLEERRYREPMQRSLLDALAAFCSSAR